MVEDPLRFTIWSLSTLLLAALAGWLLLNREKNARVLGAAFAFFAAVLIPNRIYDVWETAPEAMELVYLAGYPLAFYILSLGADEPRAWRPWALGAGVMALLVGALSFVVPCAWECPGAAPWLESGWFEFFTDLSPVLKVLLAWRLLRLDAVVLGAAGLWTSVALSLWAVTDMGLVLGGLRLAGWPEGSPLLTVILWLLTGALAWALLWRASRNTRVSEGGPRRTLALAPLALAALAIGYLRVTGEPYLFALFHLALPVAVWAILARHRPLAPAVPSP